MGCDSRYHKGELIVDNDCIYKILGLYNDYDWHYRVQWVAGNPKGKNVCGIPVSLDSKLKPFTSKVKYEQSKFVPFQRVLIRNHDNETWAISIFSHIEKYQNRFHCINGEFTQCVPYDGNEHLLGTDKDCFEYYKSWEIV